MKNLYVSLKVRIVRNGAEIKSHSEQFVGKVGIITRHLTDGEITYCRIFYKSIVQWEVYVEGIGGVYADSICLEPILPSGFTRSTETHEEFMERVRKGVTDELPS